MSNLYSLFKRSPKKWGEFQQLANALEEDVLKPTRVTGTRWIGHRYRAIKVLTRNWRALCIVFENWSTGLQPGISSTDAARMKGYLKVMNSHEFKLYFSAYQDLLEELSQLSDAFQADTMPITAVRSRVELTLASLKATLDTFTINASDSDSDLQEDLDDLAHGHEISHSQARFNAGMRKSMQAIMDCIESRFTSFAEDKTLLAFDVFDPANLPTTHEEVLAYGKEEVQTLTSHFHDLLEKQHCDIAKIPKEWLALKLDVFRHFKDMSLNQLWQKVFTTPGKVELYRNVLHLVEIMLVSPVGTAAVERQFSFIKRFLGDWRLSLNADTIEALLIICIDGPPCADFDPKPSINKWHKDAARRPT